jgi:hypothetical protein
MAGSETAQKTEQEGHTESDGVVDEILRDITSGGIEKSHGHSPVRGVRRAAQDILRNGSTVKGPYHQTCQKKKGGAKKLTMN